MSPSEVSPRLRKARAYQRGENAGKISGQERHSGRTALKNHGLNSNHVELAKKTYLYVLLSLSKSDAPNSEHGTAHNEGFRYFTKSRIKQ
jgi:hypothetical protein